MTSDLSSARTSATGRQPHDIQVSNRYPRPRTYTRRPFNLCHEGRYEVVQQVVVWFDCFYPDTQRLLWFSLYSLHTAKRLSFGVVSFSFKSTKEDSIVVVSVMACHLPAWPPVGTTGASLTTSSSTVAAWFLAFAHFGATVAGQPVLVKYPYVEPELTAEAHRHSKMVAAKTEDLQRAFAVCCIRCPCPYLHASIVFHRL